jgi:hypothetical protein
MGSAGADADVAVAPHDSTDSMNLTLLDSRRCDILSLWHLCTVYMLVTSFKKRVQITFALRPEAIFIKLM